MQAKILISLVQKSLELVPELQVLELVNLPIHIQRTKNPQHGDFACNIALILSKKIKLSPTLLAEKIIANLEPHHCILKVEVADPGFINFFLSISSQQQIILDVLQQTDTFGHSQYGQQQKILLEFVSANPTGPLHVGHGRGAAYGMAISNLLQCIGFNVDREYYLNDTGRQMDILTISVWLRYLNYLYPGIIFPENAYQGKYIQQIGADLLKQYPTKFLIDNDTKLPFTSTNKEEPEKQLEKTIGFAKRTLQDDYTLILDFSLQAIRQNIQTDLEDFGIVYDRWFSELSLYQNNDLEKYIKILTKKDLCYEKDHAIWFRSTRLGDEKDRVLIRKNGQATYFAADILYHLGKFSRGYSRLINIWGADHHGYIPRLKGALKAFDKSPKHLTILLVQFVSLYRGTQKLPMSTRSGQFITLRTLYDEIGKDATRFFYIIRKNEQHLDFDLELAKEKTNKNPVYYIQYAHARICSVLRQMNDKNYQYEPVQNKEGLAPLGTKHEIALQTMLSRYPEVIHHAACEYAPHELAYYLRELAETFHGYYNAQQFLVPDEILRNARLTLIQAVAQILKNGLALLGVFAPEKM